MIKHFFDLGCGFLFSVFSPLLDGFATRTSPTRSFASPVVLFSFLVDSRQLSREANALSAHGPIRESG